MEQTNLSTNLPSLTLVKAGAGAGKTYRIQKDLAQWIKDGKVRADRILAVTFTNAAANEMKVRIRQNLIKAGMREEANQLQQASISTIHSFGISIIERFSYEQGLSPKPRQLTEFEQNQLIRKALSKVEAIQPLLDDLKRFGYKGIFDGKIYTDGAGMLKRHVLDVINSLRSLGKGDEHVSAQASLDLLDSAELALRQIYGLNLANAETLNLALWRAVNAVQLEYPDMDVLNTEWASNGPSRSMVKAIGSATEMNIKSDWTLWKKLQTIEAPKIKKLESKKYKSFCLAKSVWDAADKLSDHPEPFNDALIHVKSLLESAIEALTLFQEDKVKAGLIDFSDMVELTEKILQTPEFFEETKGLYDCLIIDEFQDTNPLQFSLFRQFQKAGLPTLIVGDLKQSIMGFQGSDSRLFSGLIDQGEQDSNVVVDELKNNWRSTPALMKFINAVGETLYKKHYNPLTVVDDASYESELVPVQQLVFSKDIWNGQKSKTKHSIQEEGQYALANHIDKLLKQGIEITDKHTKEKRPLKPCDIAVLARKHKRLLSFSSQLKKFGIKTKLMQLDFLNTEAVQWVLCGLKFIVNPQNQFALLNLITSDYTSVTLQEALAEYIKDKRFSHPVVKKLDDVSEFIRCTDFKTAVLTVIEKLDMWNAIKTREDAPQQRANLIKLMSLAEEFEQSQSESLQAMGIYGKNLETFQVWLNQLAQDSKSKIHNQPHTQLHADNAVVLSTWHASKGLEWPIVMMLDAHHEDLPRLPNTCMAYETNEFEKMLESSFVRIFPKFDDDNTNKKVMDTLVSEELGTLKNLSYVAITRAREQVILPWFETLKDNSMLSFIEPLFESPVFKYESKNMIMIDEPEQSLGESKQHRIIKITPTDCADAIASVISPSLYHTSKDSEVSEIQATSETYGESIDLSEWDSVLLANEVGNYIHRLYEIYFLNPNLLEKGFKQLPHALQQPKILATITTMLQANQAWLTAKLKPINIQCEVSILAKNTIGQTISGSIDMLVETEEGYWIIDHKTDKKQNFKKHQEQLQTYKNALKLDKPVLGMMINWIRLGVVEGMPVITAC